MLRFVSAILLCLVTLQAFGQSGSKYQSATIMDVKSHQDASADSSGAAAYDVALRVGDTIYMVLYTPPVDTGSVKYAAGRELLVLVKEKTIRYNDILGQPYEMPIIGRKAAQKGK